jgi:hypothetical protein
VTLEKKMTSAARKPKTAAAKTSAERMGEYRKRMREKGYVQKTIWVPDVKNPKIVAEYRRQAEIIASIPFTDDDRAWLAHSERMLAEAWDDEDEK